LGDIYVKTEWKLHKSVKNTRQIETFLNEWRQYFLLLQQQNDIENRLKEIDPLKNRMNNLDSDQKQQLEELQKELFR
jgi:hypothetical protein